MGVKVACGSLHSCTHVFLICADPPDDRFAAASKPIHNEGFAKFSVVLP